MAVEEGISPATLYHWRQQARLNGGLFLADGADPEGWTARDKFTAVMEIAALNESACPARSRRADLPPGQIVPRLADQGVYLASESTFYRVLRAHDLQHHQGRAKAPSTPRPPTTLQASKLADLPLNFPQFPSPGGVAGEA